jgi:hypothetical protein
MAYGYRTSLASEAADSVVSADDFDCRKRYGRWCGFVLYALE